MIQTFDPSNGDYIDQYSFMTAPQVYSIIEKSDDSQRQWAKQKFSQRALGILKIADHLTQYKESFARQMTREMGKPIAQSRSEIEKCILTCKFFAEKGEELLRDLQIKTEFKKSYVTFQPIGVVFGVMPWNYPLWQVIRFAIPTLMAGNSVVIKHAPSVTGTALMLEKIILESGLPKGLFNIVIVEIKTIKSIVANPFVQAVTLTGSRAAGKSLASLAAQNVKKCVLELGGSDPYIVFDDADMEQAAKAAVYSRMQNGGQSCIAAKRFIVTKKSRGEFVERVVALMKQYAPTPPMKEDCVLGPIARSDLRAQLHMQVETSISQGAQLLLGGAVPSGKGFYYPATVLDRVRPGVAAFDEEIFGPVASIVHAEDEEHAMSLAARTQYGLGAAIFSKDKNKAEKLAREIVPAGMVWVNDFVRSDPRLPFGGVKESGFGRELSLFGIHEFTNVKTVVMA